MNTQKAYGWMPVLLAAAGVIGSTTAARAGDADYGVPRQVVSFTDLNLNSSAGASALYRRIESAAQRVCGDPRGARDLLTVARMNTCKEQAIGRAVDKIDSATLTSLYLAKTRRIDKPIAIAEIPR